MCKCFGQNRNKPTCGWIGVVDVFNSNLLDLYSNRLCPGPFADASLWMHRGVYQKKKNQDCFNNQYSVLKMKFASIVYILNLGS